MANITTLKQTFDATVTSCKLVMAAKHVPLLRGRPGGGKSAVGKTICKDMNWKMIDFRLNNHDTVDLTGYPELSGDKAVFKPIETFPIEGDRLPVKPEYTADYNAAITAAIGKFGSKENIPEGIWDKIEQKYCYAGWLLFMDELTNAGRTLQGAAYQVILDKATGQRKLHPKVHIMAAGNNLEDNAAANEIGTAMQSRLVHLSMQITLDELENNVAIPNQWPFEIVSYLRFKPEMLNNFDPDHNDMTYACERTWEMAADIGKQNGSFDQIKPVIVGTLGMAAATDFYSYLAVFSKIPSYQDIVSKPTTTPVPSDNMLQYAIAGMIGGKAQASDMSSIMQYLNRLHKSTAIVALRFASKRDISVGLHADVVQFCKDNRQDWGI